MRDSARPVYSAKLNIFVENQKPRTWILEMYDIYSVRKFRVQFSKKRNSNMGDLVGVFDIYIAT